MTAPLRSPSARLWDWTVSTIRPGLRPGALHFVTVLLVFAGLASLVGDLAEFANRAQQIAETHRNSGVWPFSIAELSAEVLSRIASSLTFFGTAATVEFLFRIWVELRTRRLGSPDEGAAPPPSSEL